MIAIFSYQIFTRTTMKEITTYVRQVADFASTVVLKWDFQDYLNMGCECNTLISEHCSKPTEHNLHEIPSFLSSFLGDSNTHG
jgi:hypothetical protein